VLVQTIEDKEELVVEKVTSEMIGNESIRFSCPPKRTKMNSFCVPTPNKKT
jgi:hypothetical protein